MFHLVVVLRRHWPLCVHEFMYLVLYNLFLNFQCDITFELRASIMLLFWSSVKEYAINITAILNSVAVVRHEGC